ncbi:hypothetical protein ABKV19_022594 [Rosa sericea]
MSGMSESDKEVQLAKQEGGKKELKEVKEKGKLMDEMRVKLGLVKEEEELKHLCIYNVPSKLRKVKLDAYSPRFVSIGPIHRKSLLVAAMREPKWSYMLNFLTRTENPIACLEKLTNTVYGLDRKVRRCYAEEIKPNKNELTEIMLLDGCFILQLFLLNFLGEPDPILQNAWKKASLSQDLALLENQIPFFILEELYATVLPLVSKKCNSPSSVASLALKFFQPLSPKSREGDQLVDIKFKHLLDLLHQSYFFPAEHAITMDNGCRSEPDPENTKKWGFNYCASELKESGIVFRTNESAESLLHISFTDPAVLSIPRLSINETTNSLFRNLIAYEQCSLGSKHFVTSYAVLMTSLIRSASDSKLLRAEGIIKHSRLDDKEYLVQFQSILDEVVVKDDFYFGQVCDKVTEYCKSWCNWRKLQVFLKARFLRDMKQLYSTYFSSTWSIISFLGAVVLVILTYLQTYYTMKA